MERSGFADRRPGRGIAAWAALAPLWISFLALQPGLWGIDWCRDSTTCRSADEGLSWIGAGFPHAFAFSLLGLGVPLIFAIMAGLDVALSWLALRLLPPRLSRFQAAGVLAGWMALSVVTVLIQPYLMVVVWRSTH